MKRQLLIVNQNNVAQIDGDKIDLLLRVSEIKNDSFSFEIPSDKNVNVLFDSLSFQTKEINIIINENSHVQISIFSNESFENFKLNIDVKRDSEVEVYYADFASKKYALDANINLLDAGATLKWHLASLASSKDNKTINVSAFHKHPNTFATIDNYGVCKDEAKLIFSGTSYIEKGAHKSKTLQNAKIIVFDPKSDAIAKPILKIDEHDIEASHAAIVGKINDEHLFYLKSRGLCESEAKTLITYGYLKPIVLGFQNDENNYDELILSKIEGRM